MSKAAKTKAGLERRKDKAARKAANAAKYAAWRDAGTNRKRAESKHRDRSRVKHPLGRCGNIGCVRCSELAARVRDERIERRRAG